LRDLEALPSTLDDAIEAELAELHHVILRRSALEATEPVGAVGLLRARLDERLQEIARTLLLVVEVRLGDRRIGDTARRIVKASDGRARSQALEALDALLPRQLGRRVVELLEDAPLEIRARRAVEALGAEPPALGEALQLELVGNDPLARTLAVHALGAQGRARHRGLLRAVAEAQIDRADPARLLRRILVERSDSELEEEDVLSSVQAMLSLRGIPLFAGLSPSQLGELAEVVTWETHAAGAAVLREGERPGGLVFVVSGQVRRHEHAAADAELGPGAAFGEAELFGVEAPSPGVTAVERTRVGRLSRDDFERVAEDTPGVALAVCRVLYAGAASPSARERGA
jgi:CRP-like cAMP-binding protein